MLNEWDGNNNKEYQEDQDPLDENDATHKEKKMRKYVIAMSFSHGPTKVMYLSNIYRFINSL